MGDSQGGLEALHEHFGHNLLHGVLFIPNSVPLQLGMQLLLLSPTHPRRSPCQVSRSPRGKELALGARWVWV